MSIRILNAYCEVTVESAAYAADARWQPYAVGYWQRLLGAATTEALRRGYSRHLILEQTRQEALNRLGCEIERSK